MLCKHQTHYSKWVQAIVLLKIFTVNKCKAYKWSSFFYFLYVRFCGESWTDTKRHEKCRSFASLKYLLHSVEKYMFHVFFFVVVNSCQGNGDSSHKLIQNPAIIANVLIITRYICISFVRIGDIRSTKRDICIYQRSKFKFKYE